MAEPFLSDVTLFVKAKVFPLSLRSTVINGSITGLLKKKAIAIYQT